VSVTKVSATRRTENQSLTENLSNRGCNYSQQSVQLACILQKWMQLAAIQAFTHVGANRPQEDFPTKSKTVAGREAPLPVARGRIASTCVKIASPSGKLQLLL
jgi:hypothetical protein